MCGERSARFFMYTDWFGEPVDLLKCPRCGHGFHASRYTDDQFAALYQGAYAQEYLGGDDPLFAQRQIQYKQDLAWLQEQVPALGSQEPVSALDVGCSSGLYLDAMPPHWRKHGFEVNPVHVAHIRDHKPSIELHPSFGEVPGGLDLITLRGVIEHMQDHQPLIDLLARALRPQGLLFISATPDFSSPCAALYREQWNQIACPEHIHQFTPASLSYLLARAGLVLRALHHPYMGTPYEQWATDSQTILRNQRAAQNSQAPQGTRHAACGNMMSLLFEKAG